MGALYKYINLALAATQGELGALVKSASDGIYEELRHRVHPGDGPDAGEDHPGLLSRRSARIALLGGLGSALPGALAASGPLSAAALSEHGHGRYAALGTVAGSVVGGAHHKIPGRIVGGAVGGALGHELSRRKAEKDKLMHKGANAPAAGGGAVKQPVTMEQAAAADSSDFKSDRFRRQRLAELLRRRETTETATGSISPNPPHGDS